ncbi:MULTISPECIES: PH domain-containing protein [unclassified Psychrobacter]|uniref:PH domain-containing protein n=1 Tax=unclassified Psychrobacter TaxID=196806 RepID=UPI0025F4E5DE|nr:MULTISPECIES: PH domain-containing protein [unclassified Psychrobacter]WLW65182.1 PH domain-containing protein [Psychrobacter sp. van23A]
MVNAVFTSKIDFWLAFLILGSSLLLILVPVWEWMYNNSSIKRILFISLFTMPGAILLLLIFFNVKYSLSDDELFVKNGFSTQSIPLKDIIYIIPTNSMLSAPALSLDRIEIRYEGGSIVISPKDKEGFYHAIQERVPALETDGDDGLIRN